MGAQRGEREVRDRKTEKSKLSSFALLRQGHRECKGEPHTSLTLHPKSGPWPQMPPGSTWASQR